MHRIIIGGMRGVWLVLFEPLGNHANIGGTTHGRPLDQHAKRNRQSRGDSGTPGRGFRSSDERLFQTSIRSDWRDCNGGSASLGIHGGTCGTGTVDQSRIESTTEFVKHTLPERTPPGVLCCGNIVYDTLVKPVDELYWGRGTTFVDSIEYHAGGNGANTSRALAILGLSVRLLGAIGTDEAGRFVVRVLRQSGVDTSNVAELSTRTAATVALVNSAGERKFFHGPGASCEAFAEPIDFTPELCEGLSHFHLASLFVLPRLRPRGPEMLIRARRAGLTTSFDTNWDPQEGWMTSLEPCLPHIDVLFMNEDEALMITGSSNPRSAASVVITKGLHTAVMKLGARGCAIYDEEQEIVCPAFEVDARDTTGAGDCFVAGFLAARQRGASLVEAGQFANAVAALSVQKIGAVEGVLPFAETETWMHSTPLRG